MQALHTKLALGWPCHGIRKQQELYYRGSESAVLYRTGPVKGNGHRCVEAASSPILSNRPAARPTAPIMIARSSSDGRNDVVIRSYEGLLFDMDGTLVDSTAAIEKHWQQYEEHIAPHSFPVDPFSPT